MGTTWDENAQVVDGYSFIKILMQGDINNKYLYDHPYHPPLTKYLYGLVAYFDIEDHKPSAHPILRADEPTFRYDYTYSRLLSVLFSSLSVIFIFLIGRRYFSPIVAVVGSIIFSLLPFFLGLSQLASIESILMFFFTASVYIFFRFLEDFTLKKTIIMGIVMGLALATKYTNALLFPLLIWVASIWYVHNKKSPFRKLIIKRTFLIFFISLLTFFIVWPQPWFHFSEVLRLNYELRTSDSKFSVPEVFFGRLIFVPKAYYLVMFLITTPTLLLILFFIGVFAMSGSGVKDYFSLKMFKRLVTDISKNTETLFKRIFLFVDIHPKYKYVKKNWILFAIFAWFLLPFIQSLYNFRQHGIRYIVEVYAPFSIIAAIGFDYLSSKLTPSTRTKLILFIPVSIYMFIILLKLTPYYLDYFNIVVGGNKYVYENRLFQFGWWGQGIKEAALYVEDNAERGSKIGLAVVPIGVTPPLKSLDVSEYNNGTTYDYVLVSYFNIVRIGFDDSKVRSNYYPVYEVKADGAVLVTVYKHK